MDDVLHELAAGAHLWVWLSHMSRQTARTVVRARGLDSVEATNAVANLGAHATARGSAICDKVFSIALGTARWVDLPGEMPPIMSITPPGSQACRQGHKSVAVMLCSSCRTL